MKRILLMGNPNVGKSVVFSRITGVHVVAANYPGTTVEFKKDYIKQNVGRIEVIDVPGTFSLEPVAKAEKVAVQMLQDAEVVINIVDATK